MELLNRMLDGSMLFDLKEALASASGPAFRLASDEKIRHLQRVPIFEECTRKQRRAVADISKVAEVPALAVLTREGAREDEFFVIIDGTATVKLSSRKRHRLGPGDFFGEMSLLDGEPRSATGEGGAAPAPPRPRGRGGGGGRNAGPGGGPGGPPRTPRRSPPRDVFTGSASTSE